MSSVDLLYTIIRSHLILATAPDASCFIPRTSSVETNISESDHDDDDQYYWGWDQESSSIKLLTKSDPRPTETGYTTKTYLAPRLSFAPPPTPLKPRSNPTSTQPHVSPNRSPPIGLGITGLWEEDDTTFDGCGRVELADDDNNHEELYSSGQDGSLETIGTWEDNVDGAGLGDLSSDDSSWSISIGLGILGMLNNDGSEFDGNGIVGISCAGEGALDRQREGEESEVTEYGGDGCVSGELVEEVWNTFMSMGLTDISITPGERRQF